MQSLIDSISLTGSNYVECLKEFASQTTELAKDMDEVNKVNQSVKVHQCTSAITGVQIACRTAYEMISNTEEVIHSCRSHLMDESITGCIVKTPPDIIALNVLLDRLQESLKAAKQCYYKLQQDSDKASNSCTVTARVYQ